MSANNNNPMKNTGVPIPFGSSGTMPQSMTITQNQLFSQPKPQTVGGSHFTGHFQLSEPQAQAMAQAQYAQAHAQAQAQVQAQAARAQFQAQLQAQPRSFVQLQNTAAGTLGVSSPATGSVKRNPQKPPSRPPGSSGANAASPLKTMELTPAAKRKKQKMNENQVPDKVAAILPESALYTQLLEFEARVDSALSRKKIDIQESIKGSQRTQKTLRIYVFNTFANQTQAGVEKNEAEQPSWSLKIVGRILEDGIDPGPPGTVPNSNSSSLKLSSFFKKITIYLDQSQYPDNHVILWDSSRSPMPRDGFEVKRKGDKEFTAIIRIEMNYVPEKFKLSPALAEVIGIELETRPRVVYALWNYIKVRKLQIASDTSLFMCDPPLRKVFGEEKMKFAMVSQKISQHLSPPQPLHVEHRIKLSGNSPVGNTCYDVLVDVPITLEKEMSVFLGNLQKHKEIDACDEAINSALRKINEHRRRRAFFLGFSQSPAEFINTLISSQSRDLKLAAGDANRNVDKEQRSDFYNQPWVEDAVIRYLNRKSTAGNDAPGST